MKLEDFVKTHCDVLLNYHSDGYSDFKSTRLIAECFLSQTPKSSRPMLLLLENGLPTPFRNSN